MSEMIQHVSIILLSESGIMAPEVSVNFQVTCSPVTLFQKVVQLFKAGHISKVWCRKEEQRFNNGFRCRRRYYQH